MFNLSVNVKKQKNNARKNSSDRLNSQAVFLRMPKDLYYEMEKQAYRKRLTIQKYIIKILDAHTCNKETK